MTGRSALGKGLSALIPGPRLTNTHDDYFLCPIADLAGDPNQPRQHFDDERLDDLVASIKEKGILQPIVVRKNPDAATPRYLVIAGERRLRAAGRAGLHQIPVLLKDAATDEALELALIENLQREDLNPIEEAHAYERLLATDAYTQEILARRLGRNRSTITNALRLLKLAQEHQELVIAGRLSAGHARCLLAVDDPTDRALLADTILTDDLSVRAAEDWVRKQRPSPAPRQPASPRQTPVLQPYFDALSKELSDTLSTPTRIQHHGTRGKITIDFLDLADLQKTIALIAPNIRLIPPSYD